MADVKGDALATKGSELDTTAARSAVADTYSPSAKVSVDTPARPNVITPDGQMIFSNPFGSDATTNRTTSTDGNTTTGTDGSGTTARSSDGKVIKIGATDTTIDANHAATTTATATDAQSPAAPAKPNPHAQPESAALAEHQVATLPLDVTASINPAGEIQGKVGDCYFLSTLDSMANSPQGQQMIRNMIKTNSDGSYTVTFPGDPSHPVTVTPQEMQTQIQQGAVNKDSAAWSQVAETAFFKYDGVGKFGTNALSWQNTDEGNIPWLGSTSFTDQAMHLLTGQDASTDSIGPVNAFGSNPEVTVGNTSKANLAQDIETALKNGEPITATAVENSIATSLGAHSALGPLGEKDPTSLDGDHEYAIIGYNAQTQMITVRNPWGDNTHYPNKTTRDGITGLPNGEMRMSLDTFMQKFNAVNMAGVNPYTHDISNTGLDALRTDITAGTTAKDLLTGNFGALSTDFTNLTNNATQATSDMAYAASDIAERTEETLAAPDTSLMMSAVNAMWTPTQELMLAADGMSIAARTYGSNLLSDLIPNNWSYSL